MDKNEGGAGLLGDEGHADEQAARRHPKHCVDAPGRRFWPRPNWAAARFPCQQPAAADSLIQWCEQARDDLQFDPQIQDSRAALPRAKDVWGS